MPSSWLWLRCLLCLEKLVIILTVSGLASSAISAGNDEIVFSTPAKMSSIGVVHGVTAKLRPFCNYEYISSSSVWSLRLITVSLRSLLVDVVYCGAVRILDLLWLSCLPPLMQLSQA
jgi:hypothetical protein